MLATLGPKDRNCAIWLDKENPPALRRVSSCPGKPGREISKTGYPPVAPETTELNFELGTAPTMYSR